MTTSYEEWSSAIGDEDIVRPVDAALDLVEFDAGTMFPDMMSSCSGRRQVYEDAVDSGSDIDPGEEVRGLETILEETSDDMQSDSDCSRSGPASWAWSQDSEDVHTVVGVKTHDRIETGGRCKEVSVCPSESNQATSGDEAFTDRLFSGFASSLSSQLPSLDCTFNTSATKYPFSDQGAVGEADDVGKSLDIWQQQLKRPTDLPLVKRSGSDALGGPSSSGRWQRRGEWQTFSDDESVSQLDRVETKLDDSRDSQMCDASVKRGLNPAEWESDNAVDFDNLDRRIETLTFDFEEEERRSMEFSRPFCPGDRRSVVQALSSLDVGMKRYHSFCDLSQIDSDSVEMADGKRVQGFQDGGASPTSSKSSESSSEDQISRRRPRALNAMKNSVENLSEDSGYGDHTSPPQPSDDDVSPGITPNPPVDVEAPQFPGPSDPVSLDSSADAHQEHRSVEAVNRTVISALVQSTFRDHLMWESKPLKRASCSRFSQSTPDLSPGGHRRRRLMGMMWRDAVRRQRLYVDALTSDVSDVRINASGDAVLQRSSERLSSGSSCVVQSVGDDGAAAAGTPLPAPRMSGQLRVPAVYQNVPAGAHVAAEDRTTRCSMSMSMSSPSRGTVSGVNENSYLLESSLVAGVVDCARPAAGRVISRDTDLTQSNPDLFRWPGVNVRRLLKSETDADVGGESDEPRVIYVDDEMQFVSMHRSSAGRPKPLDLRLAEEFILLEGVDDCCTESYVIDGGDERDGSEKRHDDDGVVGFTGTAAGGLWRRADCSAADGTDTHGSPTGAVREEARVFESEGDELVTTGGPQQELAMRDDSPSVVTSSDGEKSPGFIGDATGLVLCADSAPHEEQSVRLMRSCNSFKPTANGNRSNDVKKADCASSGDAGDGDLHILGPLQREVCVETNTRASGQDYSGVSSGESATFEPTLTIANSGNTNGIHKVRGERPPPPPPRVSSGIKAVDSSVPVVNDAVCNGRKSADFPNLTANVPSDVSRARHETLYEGNPTTCRVIPQENATYCAPLTIRSRDSSPVVNGCRGSDGAESNKSALPGITACHQNGTSKFKPALPPKPDALVKLRLPSRPIVSRPVIKTVDSVSAAKPDQQRQSPDDNGLNSANSGRNVCVASDFRSTDQRGKQTTSSVSSSSGGDLCTKPSAESSAAEAAMSPTSAASASSNTDSWRRSPLKCGADLGHVRWLSRSLYGLDRSVDTADRREVVPPPLLPDARRRGDSGAVSAADRVEAALQRFTRRAREDRQRLARSTPDLSMMEAATRSLASSGARRSDGSDAAVGPPATPAEEFIDRDRGAHQSTSHSVSVLVAAEGGDAAGCGGQRDTTSPAAADSVDSCSAGVAGSRERYARRRAAALARARSRTALEAQQQLPHRETDLDSVFRDLNRSIEEARSGRLKAKSLVDLATGSAAGGPADCVMSGFQSAPHDSRAKSMEFLMGEANKAATQAPENVLLQQSGRHMSEHELRFQRSLRNLNVPDWYKRSSRTDASGIRDPSGILRRDFGSGSITGGWSGLNSKSNSKESLQSSRCTTPSSSQQPRPAAAAGAAAAGGRSGRLYEWRQGASSSAAVGRPASSRDSVASSGSAGAGGMAAACPVSPAASDRGYYGATHRYGSSSSGGQSPVTGAGRPGGLYLGWRSQERLASSFSHAGYQTPSERLASSMSRMRSEGRLTATAPASRAHSRLSLPRAQPELDVHKSIRAVTSAIVDYFDSGPAGGSGAGSSAADVTRGSSPRRRRRSGAASPAPQPSWVETAFVGSKPVDEPPTPEATKSVLSVSAAPTPTPPVPLVNGDASPAPPTVVSATASMTGEATTGVSTTVQGSPYRRGSSVTVEDMLDSLLSLAPPLSTDGSSRPPSRRGASPSRRGPSPSRVIYETSLVGNRPPMVADSAPMCERNGRLPGGEGRLRSPPVSLEGRRESGGRSSADSQQWAPPSPPETSSRPNAITTVAWVSSEPETNACGYGSSTDNCASSGDSLRVQPSSPERQLLESPSEPPVRVRFDVHDAVDTSDWSAGAEVSLEELGRRLPLADEESDEMEVEGGDTDRSAATTTPPAEAELSQLEDAEDADETDSFFTIKCKNSMCLHTTRITEAKRVFKTCHNCETFYCSRDCRRAHWDRHRRVCSAIRAQSMAKQVIVKVRDEEPLLVEFSRAARQGFATHGHGLLKVFFPSPESADEFLARQTPSAADALYIKWQDLLPREMGHTVYREIIQLCKTYNPQTRLVLYVVICVFNEMPLSGAARWERQIIPRCAKLKLAALPGGDDALRALSPRITRELDELETLILVSLPNSLPEMAPERAREVNLLNILRHLRARGVSLRRDHPEVYNRLCAYSEKNAPLSPTTIYPRDSTTGKTFMCLMMPDATADQLLRIPRDCGRVKTVNVSLDYSSVER